MNKKRFLIVVILLALVGCLIGVCVFLANKDDFSLDRSSSDAITFNNWLTVGSVEELESLAEKSGIGIEYDVESVYVSNIPFGQGTATYGYSIDSDKKIKGLNIGYMIVKSTELEDSFVMEDVTPEELSNRIRSVIGWISDSLDVEIGADFCIFSYENELLSIEDDASYKSILDGTASLELSILDIDQSVWILEVNKIDGYNIVSCTFRHCSADSPEAQIPCNISIEQ